MSENPEEASEAATVSAESRVGQVIADKYRVVRLLGRGGMGEVYEARHVVVGRRFALKFLHQHLARGRDSLSRFLREAQAAGALDSEHVAAVLDFDTSADGSPFLVMEYLAGESLATLLKREGPLPVPRATAILLQVCSGLEVAHRAGIVHRDLKPDNLFVTRQANGAELIKILDFGIAKLTEPSSDGAITSSGAILGTPFYMAPEQARGEKAVDFRADIYALGVMAYELLSGKKPHPGDGYNAILAHILTQPVTPLATLRPGLDPSLVAVIERALASESTRRQSSIAELGKELSRYAGRALPPGGTHFDLRPEKNTAADAGDQVTMAAPVSAHDGTFQSAIGDVALASSNGERPRRTRWALIAVAAALSGVLLTRALSRPPNGQAPVDAASAPLERALEVQVKPPEPAAIVRAPAASADRVGAASAPSSSAVTPPALATPAAPPSQAPVAQRAAKVAPRPTRNAPVPSAVEPREQKNEVRFDEKNPY
ncbi:MAG TPA: serine/threonine-protein kinase [Polyangiaceae bacterium]|nr:serine/threonine-protein kinase [Polyangiaceae bacterium]